MMNAADTLEILERTEADAAAFGRDWKNRISFDPEPEVDLRTTIQTYFSDDLQERLVGAVEGEEMVRMWKYRHDLFRAQPHPGHGPLHHAFIVIQSTNWFWSIEKNCEDILIQRSRDVHFVRDKCKKKFRKNPIVLRRNEAVEGGRGMADLVTWLYSNDELHKDYRLLKANCQGFAKRLFRHFVGRRARDLNNN